MSPTRTTLVVQHLAFEDLGSFGPVLAEGGWHIDMRQAGVDDLSDLVSADLVVVLGGPIGVYETQTYPFLREELRLIAQRLADERPTLGICLGAQLMAGALGARVYPGGYKEIGWSPLQLTDAGQISCLRHVQDLPVLHWHGDTFDLPEGAVRLASTPHYANQAFAIGSHALGLQCHPEADGARFERWLIGHAAELNAAGLSITTLREEATRFAPGLEAAAQAMLRDWLAQLA